MGALGRALPARAPVCRPAVRLADAKEERERASQPAGQPAGTQARAYEANVKEKHIWVDMLPAGGMQNERL